MKKVFLLLLFIATLSLIYGEEFLTYTGCGVVRKVIDQSVKGEYLKEHPDCEIEIEGTGDLVGIRETNAGIADLGGTCRHKLNIPEEKYANMVPFAWDALVVVVNRQNPMINITSEQLKKVLTGEITSWKELNGDNIRINLYIRDNKHSGVGQMTRELLFGDPNVEYANSAKKFSSTTPLEAALENDKFAIAVTGLYSARKRKNLRILKLDGVNPTNENIRTANYPLFRPLYIVCDPDEATPETRDFVNLIKSAKGQSLLRKDGVITLSDAKDLWDKFEKKMKKIGVDKKLLK